MYVILGGILVATATYLVLKRILRTTEEESKVINEREVSDIKLILVARTDLKMGKGKVAAQCCHAAVMAYEKAVKYSPRILKAWKSQGQRKIVVKVNSEEEMLKIAKQASAAGLIVSLVRDAGRTQVDPGSKTVVGIGPGPAELIDQFTGHLTLY